MTKFLLKYPATRRAGNNISRPICYILHDWNIHPALPPVVVEYWPCQWVSWQQFGLGMRWCCPFRSCGIELKGGYLGLFGTWITTVYSAWRRYEPLCSPSSCTHLLLLLPMCLRRFGPSGFRGMRIYTLRLQSTAHTPVVPACTFEVPLSLFYKMCISTLN